MSRFSFKTADEFEAALEKAQEDYCDAVDHYAEVCADELASSRERMRALSNLSGAHSIVVRTVLLGIGD